MFWANLFYMILVTTFTGSILTVAWFVTSYLLDKTGHIDLSYSLSKIVVIFWIIPVTYMIIKLIDGVGFVWLGYSFDVSPVIVIVAKCIAGVWMTGIVVGMVVYIRKRIKLSKSSRQAFVCDNKTEMFFTQLKEELGLGKRRIKLRQSYSTTTAYVTGVVIPCVVINAERFTEKELKVIFSHELTHILHKDIFFRYLIAIASVLNFFNPVMWIFSKTFIKYSEYACDYSVCVRADGLREYYGILLGMAIKNKNLMDILSASLYENKSSLRERLEHVMKSFNVEKKSKSVAVILSAMFFAISILAVGGASTLVVKASVKAADVTADVEQNTYTEIVEYYEAPNEDNDGFTVVDGDDVNPDEIATYASSGTISWNIYAGVRRTTSSFYASDGQRIVTSIFSVDPSHTVRVGIIQPDGSKRYVLLNNNNAYVFELTMSGFYQVYIINDSTEKIHVEGSYDTH
jgi:bla regulator protein BlaR1